MQPPLPGDLAAGTQEGPQGAREEEGIAGWQKEIEEVTVLRGNRPWGRSGWEGHPLFPLASLRPPSGCQRPMACVRPPAHHGSSPKHHARGPSLQQLASPMVPPLPSTMLQSHSEHAVLVGARAASTQGPPKALPRAKPLQTQLPGEPPTGNGVQGPSSPPSPGPAPGAADEVPLPQVLRSHLYLSPPSSPQEGPAPTARRHHRERCQRLRQGWMELLVLSPAPCRRGTRSCAKPAG